MKEKKVLRKKMLTTTAVPSSKTQPRRILVVDDNHDIRRLNVEVLVKSGYEVEDAEDGARAWYNLQLKSYDLLITDYDMPHVTGFELLKKVRAARMAIPVIMATESLPREEYARFPWLQPTMTLLHPYTTEEFLQTVEGVLQAVDAAPERNARQARNESQSNGAGWYL
jgi:two-component system, OmpR family, response regulator ResD